MPDLGHELSFGVLLPFPVSQAATVVRLAQLAEDQGLDLIGIQDHPYNPDLLDTWTLPSHLAGATNPIRLFPDVACCHCDRLRCSRGRSPVSTCCRVGGVELGRYSSSGRPATSSQPSEPSRNWWPPLYRERVAAERAGRSGSPESAGTADRVDLVPSEGCRRVLARR
jgi:hypothetical protein